MSKTVAHELGHQFELAAQAPGHHRPGNNVMNTDPIANVSDSDFFFDPRDVLAMRRRYQSPGLSGDSNL
jgi:hypothetical protein